MPVKLNTAQPDFNERFAEFLVMRSGETNDVSRVVADIIADVRQRGDAALAEYTRTFDKVDIGTGARITHDEMIAAARQCPQKVQDALALAAERIHEYHLRQVPEGADFTDAAGVRLGWRWTPISDVGMYVPGGKASYPSSVLMNAIPAKVAGVKRLVMVVPTPNGEINPAVLCAALLAKVDEVYRIGGAQAVAALAYGTETMAPVHKIVGPGNAYVAEAKRQVFGQVGIDMIAGPSEILVIADNKNDPRWIAADLLSQAEHDAEAQSVLMTNDAGFADNVAAEIQHMLATLPRRAIAAAAWERFGAVIVVKDWMEAAKLANAIAPEHLEVATDEPGKVVTPIHNAGAIFLGRHTPEAIGDYIAGPSHVLPTSRTARFSSVLSVLDFMKRSSVIACSEQGFNALAPGGEILAEAEGLQAHALSMRIRRK